VILHIITMQKSSMLNLTAVYIEFKMHSIDMHLEGGVN